MGLRLRLVLGLVFFVLTAAPAAGQRTLVIETFQATIDVSVDGTIVVEETIRPRFTGSWNGLFRTIPIQYRTPQGLNYTLRLDVVSVTDEAGTALRYEGSTERQYRKLKIWVPGASNATRTVILRYRVPNGLRFFAEHDELYWNVTGDEWDVPIESASAFVRLPPGVSGVRTTAFLGAYGSTDRATTSIEPAGVRVQTTRGLSFREGLTVAVGWDPGIVHRPTAVERATSTVYANLPLAIPPVVFFGMLWLWRARGRDPDLGPIVTRYDPPDQMTPAEVGTLVDGRPDMRDMTATIVDLAVRGYLHIAETEQKRLFGLFASKDYDFALKRPHSEWGALKAHERGLLNAMFINGDSVTLSALKNKFYTHLPKLREGLYDMLVTSGLCANTNRVRTVYAGGGVVVGGLIAWSSGMLMTAYGMQPAAAIAAGILSGLIIALFGWFMPKRTIRGTRELEKALGFQEFLSRVEGDRLDRVVKTPEMFEKFLPYAMALGVEDEWAKAFDGIYQQPPQWYSGRSGVHAFRSSTFTNDLGRMSTQAASAMSSSPRGSGGSGLGGGGSSGGGSGGGGGGGF